MFTQRPLAAHADRLLLAADFAGTFVFAAEGALARVQAGVAIEVHALPAVPPEEEDTTAASQDVVGGGWSAAELGVSVRRQILNGLLAGSGTTKLVPSI